MSELEDKLNALLSNPQLMQQVAGLAQAMGTAQTNTPPQPQDDHKSGLPSLDAKQLNMILQAVNQSSVDKNQHALLCALSPYLSTARINKLEKAMRAAKIAGTASLFLGSNGSLLSAGR